MGWAAAEWGGGECGTAGGRTGVPSGRRRRRCRARPPPATACGVVAPPTRNGRRTHRGRHAPRARGGCAAAAGGRARLRGHTGARRPSDPFNRPPRPPSALVLVPHIAGAARWPAGPSPWGGRGVALLAPARCTAIPRVGGARKQSGRSYKQSAAGGDRVWERRWRRGVDKGCGTPAARRGGTGEPWGVHRTGARAPRQCALCGRALFSARPGVSLCHLAAAVAPGAGRVVGHHPAGQAEGKHPPTDAEGEVDGPLLRCLPALG
jgi:hypothetical protein